MKFSRRRIWIIAIATIVGLLLILASAPKDTPHAGSTYSRSPQGYAAWYGYMRDRQSSVQRWEKPLKPFFEKEKGTLLRVFPTSFTAEISSEERDWIAAGNTLVQVGVRAPVSAANFEVSLTHPLGKVEVSSTRRFKSVQPEALVLGDRFGAIIKQTKIEKGKLIQITTSYFAANAYQDAAGNYALLAQLVSQSQPIWIDEYLHGYKDQQTSAANQDSNWFVYLGKTPLVAIAIQSVILLLLLIWSQNQRFGTPQSVATAKTDNSQAYIHSLAAVLVRAGASEFVMQAIGQSEKRQLQKKLGLGITLLSHRQLLKAWEDSGRPQAELAAVLEPLERKQRISEKQLLEWLKCWQQIN